MELENAVNLAVNNVIDFRCSDITQESLELVLIKEYKDSFIEDIRSKLNRTSIYDMEFRPIQYILSPKNRYVFDYRKTAIINPSCLVKYMSIVLQFADIIENNRVPIDKNVIFSYRYKNEGSKIFDDNINYNSWKEYNKKIIETGEYQYVVECDIAAFYDRINIHRLESTLLSIGVPDNLVKQTNELLLFWSKKDSYGIPVGNAASRLLAEVALIDIDQYLLSEGIIYTRYVDDFRFFAPDLVLAQKWMNMLTNRLFHDGLMLNTSKTKIRKIVLNHFEESQSEKTEAEEVLKIITKLSGGYSRIVRKFIMPAVERYDIFMSIDIDKELQIINDKTLIEFSGIQKLVIASLVQKNFKKLIQIAEICSTYLYGLDYFIDMLLKNKSFIPIEERNEIANFYERLILKTSFNSFEWHCASVAKLLSDESYFRKNALLQIFKSPGKEVSTYPSILALEGLFDNLTRSEFKTIREWFDRCDEWEKRRVLWLSRALPVDERKAWAKAIKPTISNDLLMLKYTDSIIKEKAI